MEKNKHIAQLWFKAFNDHDIENLLILYNEYAEHYSPKLKIHQPETSGLIKGKSALRKWWQDAFTRLPDLYYEVINIVDGESLIFMEYIRKNKGEADLKVCEVLEIKDGEIIASRVYHG